MSIGLYWQSCPRGRRHPGHGLSNAPSRSHLIRRQPQSQAAMRATHYFESPDLTPHVVGGRGGGAQRNGNGIHSSGDIQSGQEHRGSRSAEPTRR